MSTFIVRWEIEVTADTPEAAARFALEIHRDPDSIATVFSVTEPVSGAEWTVDLTPPSREGVG